MDEYILVVVGVMVINFMYLDGDCIVDYENYIDWFFVWLC